MNDEPKKDCTNTGEAELALACTLHLILDVLNHGRHAKLVIALDPGQEPGDNPMVNALCHAAALCRQYDFDKILEQTPTEPNEVH